MSPYVSICLHNQSYNNRATSYEVSYLCEQINDDKKPKKYSKNNLKNTTIVNKSKMNEEKSQNRI